MKCSWLTVEHHFVSHSFGETFPKLVPLNLRGQELEDQVSEADGEAGTGLAKHRGRWLASWSVVRIVVGEGQLYCWTCGPALMLPGLLRSSTAGTDRASWWANAVTKARAGEVMGGRRCPSCESKELPTASHSFAQLHAIDSHALSSSFDQVALVFATS